MQLENTMAFAKTEIICHGARATRIGERLLHKVRKYLQSTDFVKGNISENERKEMFHSISLKGIISYPDDIANLDTECDIIYQIITDDDSHLQENLKLVTENSNGIPCIVFVIGEKKDEIVNNAYINVEENELLDTFLDLFSVYTFPQEYGADFEELRPLFEHKGQIYVVALKYLCQSVLENYIRYAFVMNGDECNLTDFERIKGESTVVLSSRKSLKDEEMKKRGYIIFKEEPYFDHNFEGIVNDIAENNGLFSIFSHAGFGKTTLALQLLKGALEKKGGKALILSREMSGKTMIERATCFLDKDKIIVDDDVIKSPFNIISENLKANSDISVVFVDSVYLRDDNMCDYKKASVQYSVPVITTSCLPRNSGDNMPRNLPKLSDLNCTSLAQESDYIIFLHRDHRAIRGVGTRENKDVSKNAQLIVAKNRYGERDIVAKAYWNKEKRRFEF
ncbi:MAG: hypothetical protein IJZ04_05915 [Clostridia bacterium]|nr:hypothetical protein [Clostridia bacterium]